MCSIPTYKCEEQRWVWQRKETKILIRRASPPVSKQSCCQPPRPVSITTTSPSDQIAVSCIISSQAEHTSSQGAISFAWFKVPVRHNMARMTSDLVTWSPEDTGMFLLKRSAWSLRKVASSLSNWRSSFNEELNIRIVMATSVVHTMINATTNCFDDFFSSTTSPYPTVWWVEATL